MSYGKEDAWNDREDMEDLSDDKIEKLRQMAMDDSANEAEGFCYNIMKEEGDCE
jgi:hypothetical protein